MGPVVRSDEVAPQPWANGGGTTRELATADDGAWRISLADIDRDGPFSSFPGRHRLLTVVDGPVLGAGRRRRRARGRAAPPVRLRRRRRRSPRSVPEGPVRVLNVIVDPAVVSPFVTVLELGRTSILPLADDQAALGPAGRRRRQRWSPAPDDLVVGPLHGRRHHPAARLTNPAGSPSRTATVRPGDRLRVEMMRATARFTVSYGDDLRFAGTDLPAPDARCWCRRGTARCRSTSTGRPRRRRCRSTCTSTAAPS